MNPAFNGRLICTDEDFTGPVAKILSELGYDILTAREDGRADQGIEDDLVLIRATELGRIVLTHNRGDFHRLHRQVPAHCGIVTCTRDKDFHALARRIDAAISAVEGTLDGILIRVIKPG